MHKYAVVYELNDRFRFPRVMGFNSEKAPFHFFLLVLLCGDVHMNPGPDYPCGKCSLNVNDDDKALCCDGCNQWIHVSCDQYISEDIYDSLVQAPSTDPWYCCSCIDLAVESNCPRQSSSLHCISFNARSIFPKRFTLLAYLSAIDADVVAITETF